MTSLPHPRFDRVVVEPSPGRALKNPRQVFSLHRTSVHRQTCVRCPVRPPRPQLSRPVTCRSRDLIRHPFCGAYVPPDLRDRFTPFAHVPHVLRVGPPRHRRDSQCAVLHLRAHRGIHPQRMSQCPFPFAVLSCRVIPSAHRLPVPSPPAHPSLAGSFRFAAAPSLSMFHLSC